MQEQRQVSVKDIAARLHVSLSTVHKALTGKPGIGEERRREVIETAREMGYVVNSAAQSLSRRSMNVGIILPSVWPEYFQQLKSGIDAQLQAMREYRIHGLYYAIPAVPAASEEERIRSWISENRIDAVLYCASHYTLNDVAEAALVHEKCPVFWVGGSADIPWSVSNITVNAELIGKLAADFLWCSTNGKPQAAILTGSLRIDIHKEKTEAFCNRMLANGGRILAVYETEDDPDKAYRAMEQLVRDHPEVNAVYVSTSTSEPVCRYLEEHALAQRIGLLGTDLFDSLKSYMNKGVMQATICQNQEEVGKLAAVSAYEYLHRTSSYGNAEWMPQRQLLVEPKLLLRANIE